MNIKRFTAAALASLMIFATTGCGNKEVADGGDVPTLKWYVMGTKLRDHDMVMDAVNEKLVDKIGAKLDLQFIDNSAFSERMNMLMASGDSFDLCFTGYINKYIDAAKKGGFLNLDKYLEKETELVESIPDYAWKGATYEGSIYAVPNVQIMVKPVGIQVSEARMKKYGVDKAAIKRTEDIEPYLAEVKKQDPDLFPFLEKWGVDSFDWKGDYEVLGDIALYKGADGKWEAKPIYEVDEYKKYVWLLNDWYNKGYIRKDVLTVMDRSADISAKKYVFSVATYKPGQDEAQRAAGRDTVTINTMPHPIFDNDCATTTLTAIGRNSKNPDKAMELIKTMNFDKEIYNMVCHGIEGVHYKMLDNGKIEWIGTDDANGYFLRIDWALGNQFNSYLFNEQPDDTWEQTEKINNEAKISELLGFYIDNKSVRTELSQIETVKNEYAVIQTGAEDPDTYYDTFLQKLKTAGIDKVCDEYAKQVNEFFANK